MNLAQLKELGITGTQLNSWRLEIEAFGSESGDFVQSIRFFRDKGGEAMMNKRAFITAGNAICGFHIMSAP